MALTPAQLIKQNKLAAKAIAESPNEKLLPRPEEGEGATEYQKLLARLGEIMITLKGMPSTEARIEFKREVIPEFDGHINGAINAMNETNSALEDEIFMQILIWNIDIADYDKAFEMAELALKFGIPMPSRYKSSLPIFLIDNICDLAHVKTKTEEYFPLEVLQKLENLIKDIPIADGATAKLCKAIGYSFLYIFNNPDENSVSGGTKSAAQNAKDYFIRALQLDKNVGVVKEIERLKNKI